MSATAAIFVLLFVACSFMALLRHPIFGVMAYVLVFYISPSDRWWGQAAIAGFRWALIAAVVTAVAIAIHRPRPPVIPLSRQPMMWGFVFFVAWVALQSFWALDPISHSDLLTYYLKYIVAMYLIYRCIDSDASLKRFMWAHVLGCTYLAWIAYTGQAGGRFDAFGGAGIGDANSGALTIVTGILAAASLFLAGSGKAKIAVIGAMPLLVNAVVATISRSGFLAFGVAGIAYNFFAPKPYAKWVRALSLVGLVLFLALTNPVYWERIQSLQYQGEEVEGVDTGSKRLTLIAAQWEMAREHPMGCGSRCTDVLSAEYLDPRQLAGGPEEPGSRSSHNTFMTMLVDHGIPGAVAYLVMVFWLATSLLRLRRALRDGDDLLSQMLPAVAGALVAITVGDLFVQYPKLEVRFWLFTIVMAMLSMTSAQRAGAAETPEHAPATATQKPLNGSVA